MHIPGASVVWRWTSVIIVLLQCICAYVPPIHISEKSSSFHSPDFLTPSSTRRTKREVTIQDRPKCQNGENSESPGTTDTSARLRRLRDKMREFSIQAYIIPTEDEHQSEYFSEYDKRRQYITGFTGSAGTAVVTMTKAALWTDGRYYLQAEEELDCNWILMKAGKKTAANPETPEIQEWLTQNNILAEGQKVGIDPKLLSFASYDKWNKALGMKYRTLVDISSNLIDMIWTDNRPPQPTENIFVLEKQFTGKPWQDKVKDVRNKMSEQIGDGKRGMLVITKLDEIAWLLNLRGNDIPFNPVFFSYLIVANDKISLYINMNKLTEAVKEHLGMSGACSTICVTQRNYNEIFAEIRRESSMNDKVMISEDSSYAIYQAVPTAKRIISESPIELMKAMKNPTEIKGLKKSHLRDAVAVIDFMAMLEKEVKAGNEWDEISASTKLEEYRSQQKNFKGLSFETISAVGSNGAIIHYKSKPLTNKLIDTKSVYLLDSGGQYLDGTTDVTRTFHFGEPSDFHKVEVFSVR